MQLLHVTRKVAHVIPDLEVLASSHEVKSSAIMDRQRALASNRLRQHQQQVSGRLQVMDGAAGFWLLGATSRTSWAPADAGTPMVLITGQQLLRAAPGAGGWVSADQRRCKSAHVWPCDASSRSNSSK